MAVSYLKKATKSSATGEDDTRATVARMLSAIEAGGEPRCIEYAAQLDGYHGNIIATSYDIAQATSRLSQQVKYDLGFAHALVT